MKTIVVEDRLTEIFSVLPMVEGIGNEMLFSPVFEFGTQFDLIAFMKLNKNNYSPYPLIWLETPYLESHGKREVSIKSLSLVVAAETKSVLTPRQRLDTTFKHLIIPVVDSIKKTIRLANTVSNDQVYEIVKHYNYGENQKSEIDAVWDAVKITFDLTVNNRCFKSIYGSNAGALDNELNHSL